MRIMHDDWVVHERWAQVVRQRTGGTHTFTRAPSHVRRTLRDPNERLLAIAAECVADVVAALIGAPGGRRDVPQVSSARSKGLEPPTF